MRHFGYHITGGERIGSSLWAVAQEGYTAAQIFLGPPQTAKLSKISGPEIQLFDQVKRDFNMKVYVHAPYVLHAFARPDRAHRNNYALRNHLMLASDLRADGYVLHMGAPKFYEEQPVTAIKTLIDLLFPSIRVTPLLLENCATGSNLAGNLGTIQNLVRVLREDGCECIGICLDTLHSWAWGDKHLYNHVSSIDLSFVSLVHLNSAPKRVEFGSKRDLHESLVDGFIPNDFFAQLLYQHPEMPVILERDSPHKVIADRALVQKIDSARENGEPIDDLVKSNIPLPQPNIFSLFTNSALSGTIVPEPE